LETLLTRSDRVHFVRKPFVDWPRTAPEPPGPFGPGRSRPGLCLLHTRFTTKISPKTFLYGPMCTVSTGFRRPLGWASDWNLDPDTAKNCADTRALRLCMQIIKDRQQHLVQFAPGAAARLLDAACLRGEVDVGSSPGTSHHGYYRVPRGPAGILCQRSGEEKAQFRASGGPYAVGNLAFALPTGGRHTNVPLTICMGPVATDSSHIFSGKVCVGRFA
jgi:hypothetical protein